MARKIGCVCLFFDLFITLKQLNSLISIYTYVQFSRWSSRNASDCGARSPRFDSRLWQGFKCLLFDCCVFCSQKIFVVFLWGMAANDNLGIYKLHVKPCFICVESARHHGYGALSISKNAVRCPANLFPRKEKC